MSEHTPGPLTQNQRHVLTRLSGVDRLVARGFGLERPNASLRVLMERGLVRCNLHDEWQITARGRAAIAKAKGEKAPS